MADEKISELGAVSGNPVDTDLLPLAQGIGTTPVTNKWSILQLRTWLATLFAPKNSAITAATKTKITYDANGFVTAGADATTADIAASTDKNYTTDAQIVKLGKYPATATNGKMLQGDGANYVEVDPPSGGGATNLGYTASPTNGTVTSDTGTDATVPLADGTNAGLLKPEKYTVLENTSGSNSGDNVTATASTLGIVKLYTSLGANTDGSLDQNTANTNFGLKWSKGGDTLSAETVLGGTSGNFGIDVKTNNLTAFKVEASPTSAVNYMTFKSSATGTGAIISTVGDSGGVPLIINLNGLNGWLDIRNSGNADTNANVKIISMYDRLASVERMAISYSVNNGMRFASAAGANYITIRAIAADQAVIPSALFLSGTVTTGPSGGSGTAAFSGIATTFAWSPTTSVAYKAYSVTSTINQTASGTGAVYGYEFAPTITANLGTVAAFRMGMASGTSRYGLYFDGTAQNHLNGNTGIGTTTTTAAVLTLAAGTTAKSSLRILSGAAPTSPQDGDIWYDGTDIKMRVGGTTKTFTLI